MRALTCVCACLLHSAWGRRYEMPIWTALDQYELPDHSFTVVQP